jgi:DNA-binding transcriptional regulator of glucitol operon
MSRKTKNRLIKVFVILVLIAFALSVMPWQMLDYF